MLGTVLNNLGNIHSKMKQYSIIKSNIMETNENIISPAEFKQTLTGFGGTENYYEHKATDYLKLLLTDGCKYVMEVANAGWLFDEILYNQPRHEIRDLSYQVWVLWFDKNTDEDEGFWVLRCEDGNKNTVMVQLIIDEVDFPINEISIWIVDGVTMLPGEY